MDYIMETDGLTKIYGSKAAADNINIHIRAEHLRCSEKQEVRLAGK